jgi:serine/threonine protein kinase
MEFCGIDCTLDRFIKRQNGLPEQLVRSYTKSLLKAVETLHDAKIMHRDIKPKNIYLKEIGVDRTVLKLGDFGCTYKLNDDESNSKATGLVGTTSYMAPEVILFGESDKYYSYSADIWSIGCVVIGNFFLYASIFYHN